MNENKKTSPPSPSSLPPPPSSKAPLTPAPPQEKAKGDLEVTGKILDQLVGGHRALQGGDKSWGEAGGEMAGGGRQVEVGRGGGARVRAAYYGYRSGQMWALVHMHSLKGLCMTSTCSVRPSGCHAIAIIIIRRLRT